MSLQDGCFYAVRLTSGKYLSRARFDPAWNGAFLLDHPELWQEQAEALEAAKTHGEGIVVQFFKMTHVGEPEHPFTPSPTVEPSK